MASHTSWNPAFMPHSVEDIIAKESAPQPIPDPESPQALEPFSIPSLPEPKGQNPETDIKDASQLSQISADGSNAQGDLDNLRDALTTSLASPGGVELDESPLHTGNVEAQETHEEKANFPSEGPAPPSKHTSTMSFTRTVTDSVDLGEDDEVDPEWHIQRTDTDPFKFMPKSDRTNSFPVVPLAHTSAINFQPVHSQAEEIIKEVEQMPRDLFGDEDAGGDDFFANHSSSLEELIAPLEPEFEQTLETGLGDYGQTLGGDVGQLEDEQSDARYEEGIPLVQPSVYPAETPTAITSDFQDDGAEDDDFFAQVSKSENQFSEPVEPPHLERKSTVQVIDSLNFQSLEEPDETMLEEISFESSHSLLSKKAAGGGLATSKSTILAEVLGDSESSVHDQNGHYRIDPESGEGDLAAKWKAALDNDEFLDDDDELLLDDDLLPDDEPVTFTDKTDPTDLFGSDDEGFLEDTNDQSSILAQQPPALAATSNGHAHTDLNGGIQSGYPNSRPSSSSNRYLPAGAQTTIAPPSNPYAPAGPQFMDLSSQGSTGPAPSAFGAPAYSSFLPTQVTRPDLPKAQSFANKAKGGYASPYDLPMEVMPVKKRVSMQQMRTATAPAQLPPPRSASMHTQPPPQSQAPPASFPLQNSSQSREIYSQPSSVASASKPPSTLKSKPSFFEELPMASRPKASRHSTLASSQVSNPYAPVQPPPPAHPQAPISHPGQGLVAPDRISPFASMPSGTVPAPSIASRYSPALVQPQGSVGVPPPLARYSSAPPQRQASAPIYNPPMPGAPAQPYTPRTSSPLAHHKDTRSASTHSLPANFDRKGSSSYESSLKPNYLPPTREVEENEQELAGNQHNSHQPLAIPSTHTPPPPQGHHGRIMTSPPKRATSNYQPQHPTSRPNAPHAFVPPQRSQTQSPGSAYNGTRLEISTAEMYQRPASVEVPSSPRYIAPTAPAPIISAGRPRGFSQAVNYIVPTDGREHDLLQRWKGAPVFAWGVGGALVTSYPKDIPRYGIGQQLPSIIRSPGEVKIQNIKDVDPLPERLTSFPGPLKGKSKKKEVLAWLTSGIQVLEQNASYLRTLQNLTHEDKRTEERILLWKILRVFIENDGSLEGNSTVDKAVRDILSPGLEEEFSASAPLYATGADFRGISESSSVNARAEPVDAAAVDQLRKHLLRGDREKAVWDAVDKRLWAHAMLIANTVSPDLYKQVAQEFVQKEVKNIGDNTESLAALYEVFAGNFEESIDELVPASARAGFKMVSTFNGAGPSKDALDGLDRWRETLGLILSNRSTGDAQALNALGKLLSGYGRAEAAHICFMFARTYTVFEGVDNPASTMVLVGSDHLRQPYQFDKEMEPILLSEVFEYGMSLSSVSNVLTSSPHLSIYKLQHALILSEYGYREKAIEYCDAIDAAMSSQTRKSLYHHALLSSELEDLSKRLKQSPRDLKGAWISKPTVDNLSKATGSWFAKFVAGEDTDSGTPSSAGATESGPFARIGGNTPTISRSPSNSDIYGSYNSNPMINQASNISSRYAPGGAFNPVNDPQTQSATSYGSVPSYGSQPRTSLEERSSGEFRRNQYGPIRRDSDYRPGSQPIPSPSYRPDSQPVSSPGYAPNDYASQTSSSYNPLKTSHAPAANTQLSHTSSPYTPQDAQNPYSPSPYNNIPYGTSQQPESVASNPYNSSLETPLQAEQTPYGSPYENHWKDSPPDSSSLDAPASTGYEPPASTGYEPPSYEPVPYTEEPDSPVETRPKKKSFMDDDDDEYSNFKSSSAPTLKAGEKTKAEKDREADEAFRKAAEADAARAKEAAPAKKGWGLGGWFGGGAKKEADSAAPAQPNKPIRAKLGESSSFIYDANLKRWVDKKAGADATPKSTGTPPPPKMAGPPRTASATGGPPTSAPRPAGPPSRMGSGSLDGPAFGAGEAAPPSASAPPGGPGLTAPPAMLRSFSAQSGGNGPPSGPPSRPGTSMSNASSIDDLLGPAIPGARKAAAGGKKKKGRGYIDVMGDKGT